MKLETKAFEEKMKKTIAVLEEEFACIRVGRASARVLDKITVPYYGTPTAVDGCEGQPLHLRPSWLSAWSAPYGAPR